MPEITTIQTYVRCDEHTLSFILQKYRHVLEQLHCQTPQVEEWLSHVTWPSWEEGFPMDFPSVTLFSEKEAFPARPFLGFFFAEGTEQWENWVELGFWFEAEYLRTTDTGLYKQHAGTLVWHILETLALAFPKNGVYFTDELQGVPVSDRVKEMVQTGKGNLWFSYKEIVPLFDAAILPRTIMDRFQTVPAIFEQKVFNETIGIIAKDRFLRIPWQTSYHP